jgi:hypothetical protein
VILVSPDGQSNSHADLHVQRLDHVLLHTALRLNDADTVAGRRPEKLPP